MPEFRKGQLVAVRDHDGAEWKLRVFDHENAGMNFCQGVEGETTMPIWWAQVRPAEEMWPDIFLGREKVHE